MTSRPVTLDDVAQLAGVSYQTASRASNRSALVPARTRERVDAALQQPNFLSYWAAQQPAGKATRTLCFSISDLALIAPAPIASAF